MNSSHSGAKGSWGNRVLIQLLTIAFGVLVFWLLGFLVQDIESIPGPTMNDIERKHLDASLLVKNAECERQLADLTRLIANKQEEKRLVGDSSQNLQRTINQLIDLQKTSLEKATVLSDADKGSLSASLNLFLENQRRYQQLNLDIAEQTARKTKLDEEKRQVERTIEQQREPARKEFDRVWGNHRLKLAFYQLLILVPLLLVGTYFLIAKRRGIYLPLFLAFGVATLLKVGLVVHEYFPSRYFKYVLTAALLGVVARLLIHVARMVAFPKADTLMRQYREAYERFLCPVCDYPIRTGPRRFLYWTRRTVQKLLPSTSTVGEMEPYTCPNCGTALFEECPTCRKTRHSLLAHCEHCGTRHDLAPELAGN